MRCKLRRWKVLVLTGLMLFLVDDTFAQEWKNGSFSGEEMDSLSFSRRFIHKFGIDVRPDYIIPTNSFISGDNEEMKPIRKSLSAHMKYSFQPYPNTYLDKIYGGSYQGIGLAAYTFGERKQIGDPFALYLFQGARIARFNPRLSFNYEWNFGMSFGWKPYDADYNYHNRMIGSEINAYINTNFYVSWMLSRQIDVVSGVNLTHFSNGNTKFPNAGMNTVGLRIGLVYNFNRKNTVFSQPLPRSFIPEFPRHISYDLVLFGSWRRKSISVDGEQLAMPDAYEVFGFNFSPMYNIGYKLRVGVSLDGVYDGSANIYTQDYYSPPENFLKPGFINQIALGLSGRVEYVMPYFTVGIGLGTNVLHRGGDLKAFYQILALKIKVTRNSFIHIGYSLHDFHNPNFLMLGIGFRFNNKYPIFRHGF